MSTHRKCLLIIDDAPSDNALEDYFSKFNYSVVHSEHLSLPVFDDTLAALLINYKFIKKDLSRLSDFYNDLSVPLVILSDLYDEEMCVRILEAGADDYLVKPIHPRELHARIGAITRRVQRSTGENEQEKEILQFSGWRLYPASRQLFNMKGEELQLSAGEYDLLLAFVRQPHRVLGREFLLQLTKHSDLIPFDRRIDVQISRLRQKIETDSKKPALIKTIRNGGYLFTANVLSSKNDEAQG